MFDHGSRARKLYLILVLDTPASRLTLAVLFAVVLSLLGCGGTDPAEAPPRLLAVDPAVGGAGTMVVLTGSELPAGSRVDFGTIPADPVTHVSPTTILAFVPEGLASTGSYVITVTAPNGQFDALPEAFRADSPRLDVVNGVSRPHGLPGSAVVLQGHSFGDLPEQGLVCFSDAESRPVAGENSAVVYWDNECIVVRVPPEAASGPLWVRTPSGESNRIRFTVGAEPASDPPLRLEDGVWRSPGPAPVMRTGHGTALVTGWNAHLDQADAQHVYVIGGLDASGRPQRTVFRAPLRAGVTGPWCAELELPRGLHAPGVLIARSWLYVAGGIVEDGEPTAGVFRARIHRDGSLGLWECQPALPAPRVAPRLTCQEGVLRAEPGGPGATHSEPPSTPHAVESYAHRLDLPSGELIGAWEVLPPGAGP